MGDAFFNVPDDIEDKVKRALAEPDTREIEIAEAVAKSGRRLCTDTQTPGSYAVVDVIYGRLELAVVGLDAVESWLERAQEGVVSLPTGDKSIKPVTAKYLELCHANNSLIDDEIAEQFRKHGWYTAGINGNHLTSKGDWSIEGLRSFLAALDLWGFAYVDAFEREEPMRAHS